MRGAIIKVPLKVSTMDFAIAEPLTFCKCTKLLSRLDGEVGKPHVLLRSPNMSNKLSTSKSNQQIS
jgi:hypothetical protein